MVKRCLKYNSDVLDLAEVMNYRLLIVPKKIFTGFCLHYEFSCMYLLLFTPN